ncbi:MAG: 2-oxoglutarate ferredoxin oxidoreductase subunit alpha [Chthonomonadaceae bacterium]|uniref:2-oxoacid:acceptor oxidoreductase subunit alpha n=1 Tax=Candidatus Nitrosymbiomonas proteolyticus TaxID=2608984 RepID=A0A809RV62_9BACT|nr:2-oxoacid:acceptor oxidoreductase subunit alpha [Candidatus Nitrosymbiomonas proteolyticus]
MNDPVNDFALRIATANGTGSASANNLLMQAIFRMGIPVSGKNLFPSNIQGLPTWYEIRVSNKGYTARPKDFDLLAALNAATMAQDIAGMKSGGWVLFDSSRPLDKKLGRDDLHFIGVPFARLCNSNFEGVRERILMKNIAYVGAVGALLDIDKDTLAALTAEKFKKKPALLKSNQKAIELGYSYTKKHFECPLPIRLTKMDSTREHILIDGNTSAALGCLYAGATVGAWYPITPATSLMEAFSAFCQRYRKNPKSGKNRFAIVQAEDELSAIGMVIGASWAGARAFTSTSGPGVSLMNEFLGLAYYAEIPAVLFDVQRTGPSTGMPTRTQQADLLTCAYASHGDTKHICLYPADPKEAFDMAVKAFDLAEQFQTPVIVLSDLDIGMNDWMTPKLQWDDNYRPNRGKVLSAEELERIERFYRYMDIDEDGVPYRTLPGVHPKGSYFTRGSGHNRFGFYTEDSDEYREVMDRITRKFETASKAVPEALIHGSGARTGLVTLGSGHAACSEAVDLMKERGDGMDYMRIRGFPFGPEVKEFLLAHEVNYIVEQNRDGQLRRLLMIETEVPADRLRSVLYYAGMPLCAECVVEGVQAFSGVPA